MLSILSTTLGIRLRSIALPLTFVTLCGCGMGSNQPHPLRTPLSVIENAVDDIHSQINAPKYRPTGDLGSDSDRIGFAFMSFNKAAEGKGVDAETRLITDRLTALEKLAASKAPVEKQKKAVNDLKEAVAALKAKID
jgi:hypothetical protein